MKSNFRFSCIILAAASCLTFAYAAKDVKDVKDAKVAPVTRKTPVLMTDNSPVSQGVAPGIVTSFADVIEPVQKAVVSVYSTKIVHQQVNPLLRQLYGDSIPSQRDSKEQGLGSGVIVSPDGYILTNNHVVEGADELKVLLPDEREFTAKVIGADPKTDIAIIKIEADSLPVVTLADSDKLRVGDVVFAVGNPLGVGQTVTMGIVSAKGRSIGILDDVQGYEDFIQTDAAINMGNSGGALIDAKGRLIGINSAILSPSRGSIGIGFAVPVNLASSIMHSLIETGTVARGFLGIAVDPVTSDLAEALGLKKEVKGVVITNVDPNTPAAKAGLKQEDVVLSIDGKAITSRDELRLLISQKAPDSLVQLKYLRSSKGRDPEEHTIEVKLAQRTDDGIGQNEFLKGVTVARLTDDLRRNLNISDDRIADGLVVTAVDDTSPYSDRLREKMVILQINRVDITDLASAQAALQPGHNIFFVYRRGNFGYIPIEVK
jgi:Do/DeqQ family serine protease